MTADKTFSQVIKSECSTSSEPSAILVDSCKDLLKLHFHPFTSHRRVRAAAADSDVVVVKSAMLLQKSVILLALAMTAAEAKFRTMGCRPCGVGKMGKMDMASEEGKIQLA